MALGSPGPRRPVSPHGQVCWPCGSGGLWPLQHRGCGIVYCMPQGLRCPHLHAPLDVALQLGDTRGVRGEHKTAICPPLLGAGRGAGAGRLLPSALGLGDGGAQTTQHLAGTMSRSCQGWWRRWQFPSPDCPRQELVSVLGAHSLPAAERAQAAPSQGRSHVRQCQRVGRSRREPSQPPRSQHCCSAVIASDPPAAGFLSGRGGWVGGCPANGSLCTHSTPSHPPRSLHRTAPAGATFEQGSAASTRSATHLE